jgi:hypothetical protein
MADPALIAVRTEVVLDVLIGSMHAAAAERAEGAGVDWLASMGWHARALERERFAPARAELPWLTALLERSAAAEVSAQLARQEPLERPEPRTTPSWRVPGPGGHVRHYLALRAIEALGERPSLPLKRAWMGGFFRHCCDECAAPSA